MSNFMGEFRKFALRGNVVDMAVGIIIGGAFSTIVKSLVDDVIMPPIGLLLGGVDFTDLYILLRPGEQPLPANATLSMAQEAGAVTLNYGQFINNVISFLLVALAVFLLIRMMNRLQENFDPHEQVEETPQTKECPYCFNTIDIKARRCPYCTSDLEKKPPQSEPKLA
jgi:large conductance mechanosensitive channel